MPDHPSWPAELVEKATAALHEGGIDPSSGKNIVQMVLSALSGDLVPREDAVKQIERLCDHNAELVEKVSADDGSDLPPARVLVAQADALAEALEEAQWGTESLCPVCWDPDGTADRLGWPIYGIEPDHHPDCKIGRALAYRKTASGETE